MNDYTSLVPDLKSVVIIPVEIVVGGWILKVAAKKLFNCPLTVGRACLITFTNILVCKLIDVMLKLMLGEWVWRSDSGFSFVLVIASFLAGSVIYGKMTKPNQSATPIGFPKGMLVWLIVTVAFTAIFDVCMVAYYGVYALALSHMPRHL